MQHVDLQDHGVIALAVLVFVSAQSDQSAVVVDSRLFASDHTQDF
jgi:hypothetical protein